MSGANPASGPLGDREGWLKTSRDPAEDGPIRASGRRWSALAGPGDDCSTLENRCNSFSPVLRCARTFLTLAQTRNQVVVPQNQSKHLLIC